MPRNNELSDTRWEDEFRPSGYEDVRGQETAVRLLSGLARRRIGRSLLLAGAIGSGKTSFARLHARALNCDTPNTHASACRTCGSCRLPLNEVMLEINAASMAGEPTSVAAKLKEWNRQPGHCRFRIIFFDEAHNLPPKSQELLLKPVEEPTPNVVFIFATTEPLRLLSPLRSRLMQVRIEMFSRADALRLLRQLSENKGLSVDPGALNLIAAAKRYPRDMIISLQQLSEYEAHIDVGLVKDVLDLSICDRLEEYMLALARADRLGQIVAMDSWRDSYSTKARWIRLFILTAYYNEVLSQHAVVEPLCYELHRARLAFVQNISARLSLHNKQALTAFFEKMIGLWHEHRVRDESELQLVFALLEAMCNMDCDVDIVSGAKPNQIDLTRDAAEGTSITPAAGQTAPTITATGFISGEDVRQIVNRASFLRQHHGALFNLAIRLEVRASRFATDAHAVAELESCCQLVLEQLRVKPDASGILTFENNDGVIVLRLVTYHDVRKAEVEPRMAKLLQKIRTEKAIEGQFLAESNDAEFHWSAVRELCAGYCEDASGDLTRSLRERLKIPKGDWRFPAPLGGVCLRFTGLLRTNAIAAACVNEMDAVSAIDEEAWPHLYTDWEEKEYIDRSREIDIRRETVAVLSYRYGTESPAFASEMQALQILWKNAGTKGRARSWSGWLNA